MMACQLEYSGKDENSPDPKEKVRLPLLLTYTELYDEPKKLRVKPRLVDEEELSSFCPSVFARNRGGPWRGGLGYVWRSRDDVLGVPPATVVTVMSTVPVPAGATAVRTVSDRTVNDTAAVDPKSTSVVPVRLLAK